LLMLLRDLVEKIKEECFGKLTKWLVTVSKGNLSNTLLGCMIS
jgi:hypothetical protein